MDQLGEAGMLGMKEVHCNFSHVPVYFHDDNDDDDEEG
jgi:hypothetical protein